MKTSDELKELTRAGFTRMFGEGDLAYVDQVFAPGAIDHQEPDGTDVTAHLKDVVATLRRAFPDLHFDVQEMLCESNVVACRSRMTGTHRGALEIGPLAGLPVDGKQVDVAHMHFFAYDDDGRVTDLWHVWNTLGLARQLGAPAPDLRVGVGG